MEWVIKWINIWFQFTLYVNNNANVNTKDFRRDKHISNMRRRDLKLTNAKSSPT